MNRRHMFILPGAAVAAVASEGLVRAQAAGGSAATSRKAVLKYTSPKASYKVPKNDTKSAKYLTYLTTLLGLSDAQQQQATSILSTAVSVRTSVRHELKATRKSLREAVMNNDTARIEQLSAAIGNLTGRRFANGANANAALFRVLTAEQQNKLTQSRS
jgi:Spy/CpxP family protein refolding chaperone